MMAVGAGTPLEPRNRPSKSGRGDWIRTSDPLRLKQGILPYKVAAPYLPSVLVTAVIALVALVQPA
jgi:hypothetical protein